MGFGTYPSVYVPRMRSPVRRLFLALMLPGCMTNVETVRQPITATPPTESEVKAVADVRAVGQAVQDASYLVTVPPICPDVPIMHRDPVVGYLPDLFTRPAPLRPDIVIDISDRMETIVRMLAAHRSQFFEWLPYNERRLEEVPAGEPEKLAWLRRLYETKIASYADRYRNELVAEYGSDRGNGFAFCEVFEISEYAAPLDDSARRRQLWFLPRSGSG